jgi:polyhydroxybutyrate depolymerase
VLLAAVLVGACGRGIPEPGADERAALTSARAVASEPSRGCRPGTLAARHGTRAEVVLGGERRSYLLDAPAGSAERPLAVVFTFHGFRSSAWRHRWWTGWGRLARQEGFIAVSPEGHEGVALIGKTGRGWDLRPSETRDLDFVRALLDRLEEERCVDRRRVFATGMSNGGFFANLLGCVFADRLAAIAPVAGAMPLLGCTPVRTPPVLLIYGTGDRVVRADMVRGARAWWSEVAACEDSEERDGCTYFQRCAADVVYCEGTHAHRWPGDATARIWRFFEAHPRR